MSSVRLKKILDAKYAPADLDEIVRQCVHLTDDAKTKLYVLLTKYEHLLMTYLESEPMSPIILN